MKRIFLLFLAFVLLFVFAGCSKRMVTMPVTQEVSKETAQKTAAPESVKKAEPAKEAPVATKEEPQKVETVPVKEVVESKLPAAPVKETVESRTIASPVKEAVESRAVATPSTAVFENIHFDFDTYTIREDAKPTLKSAADWLIKNRDAKMILEGHCDERGTNEYNLALGEKRAKSAMDYLVSAGVTKDRVDIISFGEEKPLCKEQTEDCWQKNRRVQFIIQTTSGTAGK